MNLTQSDRSRELQVRLQAFMDAHVYPSEDRYKREVAADPNNPAPVVEELKARAKAEGLWNLFFSSPEYGPALSNLEFAPLCEIMARVYFSQEVFNCSAPDTGNMETLARYGTPGQKAEWLVPLAEGAIRSSFSMTEPDVPSSDATAISCRVEREGDHYVINGRKWWSSGAMDPRCRLLVVMGKSPVNPAEKYRQHSMILVPKDTPGVRIIRNLSVFGYSDLPHGHAEIEYDDVRVPVGNMLLGEGRGFEIAQGRLGPGRIHYGMRLVGFAERGLEMMCRRVLSRAPFGKLLADQSVWRERIAEARCMIDQVRLLTLKTAYMMDTVGNKEARAEIAMIKVAAPSMVQKVLDWSIQAHGGGGVGPDYFLAAAYARTRVFRIADGPDEVHRDQLARTELRKYR